MRINGFSFREVELTEPVFENAFVREQEYLRSIDVDRLLSGFTETAGKQKKAERYPGGWEDTEIAGHTLGHFMTALAQLYAATGAKDIDEKLDYLLSELSSCQRADGFLFANGEELFDKLERGEQVWVPWYTMHKIVAGLLSVYELTGKQQALSILNSLGEWIAARTEGFSHEVHERVLNMEYGGMNDCLYELFQITGQERILRAAECFDETKLFETIAAGKDILAGKHANTTIPKFLGAVNRYMTVGEEAREYLNAAISFFHIVKNNHTYITGGNSEWEHFRTPGTLGRERTNCNCETCNTYNMLKLSERLYKITGEKEYMDFYEQTFLNAILGSQNPETGMTTYFQPMASGYFKTYSRPYDNFWCCTGTGMENFTKLNNQIYHQTEKELIVNLFISSILKDNSRQIELIQKTELDRFETVNLTVIAEESRQFSLLVRIPEWTKNHFEVKLNGAPAEYSVKDGYLRIDRKWGGREQLLIYFAPEIEIHPLPDLSCSAAVSYGPFALAAGLSNEDMTTELTGVNVTIPTKKVPVREKIMIKGQSVKEWFLACRKNFVKLPNEPAFTLQGTDADGELVFTPYYKHYADRFALYFDYETEKQSLKEETEKKVNQIREQLKPILQSETSPAPEPTAPKAEAAEQTGKKKPNNEKKQELAKKGKHVLILLGGHLATMFLLLLLAYLFANPVGKFFHNAKSSLDTFFDRSFPSLKDKEAVQQEAEKKKERYLTTPEETIAAWKLKEGYTAEVAYLDEAEYILIKGQDIKIFYPNEKRREELQQIIMVNKTSRAAYYWNYSFDKPESLCPEPYEITDRSEVQYLFRLDELHAVDQKELYELIIEPVYPALCQFVEINAYSEKDGNVIVDASVQKVPYLFAAPKGEGGFLTDLYQPKPQEEISYTFEPDGIRVDTYVTMAGMYVGKMTGKLVPVNHLYQLTGVRFYAFTTGEFGNVDGGGIVHGVTKEVADKERVLITGDQGEKLLIEVREDIGKIAIQKENIKKMGSGELYYQENGETISIKGVDVSKYQEDIDWEKVAADGVKFAIIRLGFRGMGTNGTCELDPYFKQNMEGALAAGIKVGVYFFTQAVTKEEAEEEASFVIENLKGYQITWPVIIDSEEITSYKEARANVMPNTLRTDITIAFLEKIKEAGYIPMIYANTRWSILRLELWRLTDYDFWYAFYGEDIYYPYKFTMWQYASDGRVNGIKGDTDMNLSFVDYGAR